MWVDAGVEVSGTACMFGSAVSLYKNNRQYTPKLEAKIQPVFTPIWHISDLNLCGKNIKSIYATNLTGVSRAPTLLTVSHTPERISCSGQYASSAQSGKIDSRKIEPLLEQTEKINTENNQKSSLQRNLIIFWKIVFSQTVSFTFSFKGTQA